MEMWRQNLGITNIEFKVKPDEFGEDEKKLNLLRDDVVTRFPDAATYLWTGTSSQGPSRRRLCAATTTPRSMPC